MRTELRCVPEVRTVEGLVLRRWIAVLPSGKEVTLWVWRTEGTPEAIADLVVMEPGASVRPPVLLNPRTALGEPPIP